MRIKKWSFILASMLMFVVLIKMNGDVHSFIYSLKQDDVMVASFTPKLSQQEKDELFQKIKSEAESRKIAPINARIDRVFHAIPGYNGLEVDIQATYEANLTTIRGDSIQYIYKEIEPEIGLDELGAQPIYKGNPEKKMIAFMINVAWGNEYIDSILSTLEKEGVHSTFFLDGSWLNKNEELALKIKNAGHELSNHAYSHPNMSTLSRYDQHTQIDKTEQLLKKIGVQNQWFAPPSGDFNMTTVEIARQNGLKTVLWTIDTIDWRKPPAENIIKRVNAKLEPGALILMHPTLSTTEALPQMIIDIKKAGYRIGTVSETLSSARLTESVEGAGLF